MELFGPAIRPAELSDAERQKALALLQVLLTEALMASSNNNTEEAGYEQDHH
jgi:hypothetical protein